MEDLIAILSVVSASFEETNLLVLLVMYVIARHAGEQFADEECRSLASRFAAVCSLLYFVQNLQHHNLVFLGFVLRSAVAAGLIYAFLLFLLPSVVAIRSFLHHWSRPS